MNGPRPPRRGRMRISEAESDPKPQRRWFQFYPWHPFVLVKLFAVACSALAVHRVLGVFLLLAPAIVLGDIGEKWLRRHSLVQLLDTCFYVVLLLFLLPFVLLALLPAGM